jgi:hypothetical protein
MAHDLTDFFSDEEQRRLRFLKLLEPVMEQPLQRTFINVGPTRTFKTDGGTPNPRNEFKPPTASQVEVKKEKTEESCEASIEVLLYYYEGVQWIFTLTDVIALAWKQTRLPSMLIVHAGPNLQVFGATWNSKHPYMEVLSPDLTPCPFICVISMLDGISLFF